MFLITFKDYVSEFKYNFEQVQEEMNRLEKKGSVTGVVVEKFVENKLVKSFTYDYNGEEWEKR